MHVSHSEVPLFRPIVTKSNNEMILEKKGSVSLDVNSTLADGSTNMSGSLIVRHIFLQKQNKYKLKGVFCVTSVTKSPGG